VAFSDITLIPNFVEIYKLVQQFKWVTPPPPHTHTEHGRLKKRSPYEGVSKSFRADSITKYTLTYGINRWEATQSAMAAKLTRLTYKIAPGGPSGNLWIHPRIARQGGGEVGIEMFTVPRVALYHSCPPPPVLIDRMALGGRDKIVMLSAANWVGGVLFRSRSLESLPLSPRP
jgi:hypothetical protein